jgi:hypothetical protein
VTILSTTSNSSSVSFYGEDEKDTKVSDDGVLQGRKFYKKMRGGFAAITIT